MLLIPEEMAGAALILGSAGRGVGPGRASYGIGPRRRCFTLPAGEESADIATKDC